MKGFKGFLGELLEDNLDIPRWGEGTNSRAPEKQSPD